MSAVSFAGVLLILAIVCGVIWLYWDMVADWKARPITGTIGLILFALSILAGVIYPYI